MFCYEDQYMERTWKCSGCNYYGSCRRSSVRSKTFGLFRNRHTIPDTHNGRTYFGAIKSACKWNMGQEHIRVSILSAQLMHPLLLMCSTEFFTHLHLSEQQGLDLYGQLFWFGTVHLYKNGLQGNERHHFCFNIHGFKVFLAYKLWACW